MGVRGTESTHSDPCLSQDGRGCTGCHAFPKLVTELGLDLKTVVLCVWHRGWQSWFWILQLFIAPFADLNNNSLLTLEGAERVIG